MVELLMVEHASLRLHFQFARKTANWDAVYEVEEFVRHCHAKVEDDIVFPKLREMLRDKPEGELVLKNLSRLEADHRLIETIGDQIRQRTIQGGDLDTLRKRVLLFATTVESHNSSEESLLFPYWKSEEKAAANLEAEQTLKIIREFGESRYFEVTGISEKLLGTLGK
ncbi:MAG: hemerythrin domain-containing protein [Nitrososphaerales archaeon]